MRQNSYNTTASSTERHPRQAMYKPLFSKYFEYIFKNHNLNYLQFSIIFFLLKSIYLNLKTHALSL